MPAYYWASQDYLRNQSSCRDAGKSLMPRYVSHSRRVLYNSTQVQTPSVWCTLSVVKLRGYHNIFLSHYLHHKYKYLIFLCSKNFFLFYFTTFDNAKCFYKSVNLSLCSEPGGQAYLVIQIWRPAEIILYSYITWNDIPQAKAEKLELKAKAEKLELSKCIFNDLSLVDPRHSDAHLCRWLVGLFFLYVFFIYSHHGLTF